MQHRLISHRKTHFREISFAEFQLTEQNFQRLFPFRKTIISIISLLQSYRTNTFTYEYRVYW